MEIEPDNSSPLDELLITKLEIPCLASRIVRRDRLTTLVHAKEERQVTIVVAPGGYGKTTLLLDWLSTVPTGEYRTAWLNLDLFDNTPLRFWSYIAAALNKAHPSARFNPDLILQHGYDPKDFTRLAPLINEIAHVPYQLCLVLDDYHTITDENIHHSLSYLIDHQPRNLHLVFSSRTIPPLPLSRLRTLNRLVEITSADLSFDLQETKKYLSEVMNLEPNSAQVSFMFKTTEGWIAGLQMEALSLQNHPKRQQSLKGFLSEPREILDYFIEEVLSQQDAKTQDFLLKTSVLTELSAVLCNALLEISNSRDFLNKLELARLFLVPIDSHRLWYRYHPLFAAALSAQLKKKDPAQIPMLHAKAYTWLLENGYPDKAVSHALAVGDLEKAAEIIDACAMQAIIDFDVNRLLHWIDSISEDFLSRRPSLGVYSALAFFLLGQLDLVEPNIQMAENALNAIQKNLISVEDEKLMRWEMAAIRATIECLTGNFIPGIAHGKELMKDKQREKVYTYGAMTHALGVAYEAQGDLNSAAEAYRKGNQVGKTHHFLYGVLHSGFSLAHVYKLQGHLQKAKHEYHEALNFAREHRLDDAAVSLAQIGLLQIALEQNDIHEADLLAQDVITHLDSVEVSASYWMNHALRCLNLAKYSLYYQDIERARQLFMDGLKSFRESKLAKKLPPEMVEVYVDIWLVLKKNDPDDAWFEEVGDLVKSTAISGPVEQLAMARMDLAQKQAARALVVLNNVVETQRGSGFGDYLLKSLILQAMAFQADQQIEKALNSIGGALRLSEPEGYMRSFVSKGEPMKTLLAEYLSTRKSAGFDPGETRLRMYVEALLKAFDQSPALSPLAARQTEPRVTAVFPLQEPLSQRELQVLKMLVAGKTIKNIAEELTISINTAKTHVKNVYRKTGTHTRALLAQHAAERGIIQ